MVNLYFILPPNEYLADEAECFVQQLPVRIVSFSTFSRDDLSHIYHHGAFLLLASVHPVAQETVIAIYFKRKLWKEVKQFHCSPARWSSTSFMLVPYGTYVIPASARALSNDDDSSSPGDDSMAISGMVHWARRIGIWFINWDYNANCCCYSS